MSYACSGLPGADARFVQCTTKRSLPLCEMSEPVSSGEFVLTADCRCDADVTEEILSWG